MSASLSPLVVLALIARHLRPVLGWRTAPFLAAWAVRLPSYRSRFLLRDDDPALSECKRAFLPLAALHHELAHRIGQERALLVSHAVDLDVATRLQRRWYLVPRAERTWEAFHREHDRQMQYGLNEYLPEMRFHRDERPANTIARGATACGFIFERSPTKG